MKLQQKLPVLTLFAYLQSISQTSGQTVSCLLNLFLWVYIFFCICHFTPSVCVFFNFFYYFFFFVLKFGFWSVSIVWFIVLVSVFISVLPMLSFIHLCFHNQLAPPTISPIPVCFFSKCLSAFLGSTMSTTIDRKEIFKSTHDGQCLLLYCPNSNVQIFRDPKLNR